ncbi:hypothetical protein [Dinghuibacter silviterrae]|uniref:Uncharacterized protein n=1 Tax=Dinghuibacter silviterrae TaxID=1539049 RepID=A0A4R8DHX9_9BACT|nr:hypothetical protein [Dinghuibacter silviterrae]TDW97147.1 hypothetical protein EDB95_4989 [Dinghuibacter silviterrae]
MKTKLIPLPRQKKEPDEKVSVADCRAILQEEAGDLSDARVIEIRDYLYRLAALAWEQHEHEKREYEKSNYLRTG